jgi:protocatechuate 4,5-dioxygenase alpha chain
LSLNAIAASPPAATPAILNRLANLAFLQEPEMERPPCNLEAPGSLAFTAQLAFQGHRLNKFALSLRSPANRVAFLGDEDGYMVRWGLTAIEREAVTRRDWSALWQSGGHLQAILKIAATVGQGLWHIGAHHANVDVATLQAVCPRSIDILPPGNP